MKRIKTKLYKFAFIKSWFDAGYGETSVIKYAAAAFGMTKSIIEQDMTTLYLAGIAYAIFCLVLGWVMYHIPSREHNWMLATQEVRNQFDYFAKEVRTKLKGKNI